MSEDAPDDSVPSVDEPSDPIPSLDRGTELVAIGPGPEPTETWPPPPPAVEPTGESGSWPPPPPKVEPPATEEPSPAPTDFPVYHLKDISSDAVLLQIFQYVDDFRTLNRCCLASATSRFRAITCSDSLWDPHLATLRENGFLDQFFPVNESDKDMLRPALADFPNDASRRTIFTVLKRQGEFFEERVALPLMRTRSKYNCGCFCVALFCAFVLPMLITLGTLGATICLIVRHTTAHPSTYLISSFVLVIVFGCVPIGIIFLLVLVRPFVNEKYQRSRFSFLQPHYASLHSHLRPKQFISYSPLDFEIQKTPNQLISGCRNDNDVPCIERDTEGILHCGLFAIFPTLIFAIALFQIVEGFAGGRRIVALVPVLCLFWLSAVLNVGMVAVWFLVARGKGKRILGLCCKGIDTGSSNDQFCCCCWKKRKEEEWELLSDLEFAKLKWFYFVFVLSAWILVSVTFTYGIVTMAVDESLVLFVVIPLSIGVLIGLIAAVLVFVFGRVKLKCFDQKEICPQYFRGNPCSAEHALWIIPITPCVLMVLTLVVGVIVFGLTGSKYLALIPLALMGGFSVIGVFGISIGCISTTLCDMSRAWPRYYGILCSDECFQCWCKQ